MWELFEIVMWKRVKWAKNSSCQEILMLSGKKCFEELNILGEQCRLYVNHVEKF